MFFVSMLASITGSLIGGTSLITIPTLIMLGVPAHTAIGTDRFAIFGGVLVGLYKFHKKGLIRYRVGITVGIPVLVPPWVPDCRWSSVKNSLNWPSLS